MNRLRRSVSGTMVLVGCLFASDASAQGLPFGLTAVESTRPLRIVQESPHPPLRGRLLKAGEGTITLVVDGRSIDVPLARITRIDVAGDSLLNGALIGAAAMGGWCAAVCGQGLSHRGSLPFPVLLNGGVGALIGAGIDRLTGRGRPVYVRPSRRGGLGVEMALRF